METLAFVGIPKRVPMNWSPTSTSETKIPVERFLAQSLSVTHSIQSLLQRIPRALKLLNRLKPLTVQSNWL